MTILADVKNYVQVLEAEDVFDAELLTHINTSVATLNQLGVTEFDSVIVDAAEEWPVFTSPFMAAMIKSHVKQFTKTNFDPSANAVVANANAASISQIEQRIMYELTEEVEDE